MLKQHQAPERGARHQRLETGREPARIQRVKAVDILVRVDGGDDQLFIDMAGKRKLDQDSIDRIIGVQLLDERNELVLRGLGGQLVLEALHPRFARRLGFGAHISGRRRMLSDQDHGKAGSATPNAGEFGSAERNALAERGGERFAVDQPRGHPPR